MWQVAVIGSMFAFGLVMLWTLVAKSRREGLTDGQLQSERDARQRLERAIKADASARARDAGDGLLQDDGHCRDCL